MKAPDESIRIVDQAVRDWLGDILVDYSDVPPLNPPQHPIIRVPTGPERTVSNARFQLVAQGLLPPETVNDVPSDLNDQALPLPYIRIGNTGVDPQTDRGHNVGYRPKLFVDGQWRSFHHPQPFLATYEIELVSKKEFTQTYLFKSVVDKINKPGASVKGCFIPAQYPEPWGLQLLPLTMTSFSDTGDPTAQQGKERRLSRTINVEVLFWNMDTTGGLPSGVVLEPSVLTSEINPAFLMRVAHASETQTLGSVEWASWPKEMWRSESFDNDGQRIAVTTANVPARTWGLPSMNGGGRFTAEVTAIRTNGQPAKLLCNSGIVSGSQRNGVLSGAVVAKQYGLFDVSIPLPPSPAPFVWDLQFSDEDNLPIHLSIGPSRMTRNALILDAKPPFSASYTVPCTEGVKYVVSAFCGTEPASITVTNGGNTVLWSLTASSNSRAIIITAQGSSFTVAINSGTPTRIQASPLPV